MKIKEEKSCCAFVWSPKTISDRTMVAAASVAGAMDDDFSSEFFLTLFEVDLKDFRSTEMATVARARISDRVHRLDWSPHGGKYGMIAAGFVDGQVIVWSVDKLVEQASDAPDDAAVIARIGEHQGAVRACAFNALEPWFLATGGADKTVRIWNLQDPNEVKEVPVCGKNNTVTGEITDIRWNPKFRHILASSTTNGIVTVWDLKTNRIACTLQVAQNQTIPCNAIAWHPESAMLMAVARDDPLPAVQIWDLKKAMSPAHEITGHANGVLGLSWCSSDTSMIVSCGRDGRTVFWHESAANGETKWTRSGELSQQTNWVFDVQWAPRAPSIICSSSFDASLAVHSTQDVAQDRSGQAPKWLSRPCPATFGYGGRIALPADNKRRIKIVPYEAKGSEDNNSVVAKERVFKDGLKAPLGDADRCSFLEANGHLASAASERASAAGHKGPILAFLHCDPVKAVEDAKEPTDREQTISKCVVSGQLAAAVDACLAGENPSFEDAFAIAHLAGAEQMARVHAAYAAKRKGTMRFAAYLGAVAQNNFKDLASDPNLPWEEILALYATFVQPQAFSDTCNALATELETAGNLGAAATAFVLAGNVDAAAGVFAAQKQFSAQELVHKVVALEQAVNRRCTRKEFAEALSTFANQLAAGGDFESAMANAARAAELGLPEAAIVADRVQFQVAGQARASITFPFGPVTPLPDASTPECQILASQQQQVATPVVQQQPAQTVAPARQTDMATRTGGVAPHPAAAHNVAPTPAVGQHHQHHQHHHQDPRAVTGPAPVYPAPTPKPALPTPVTQPQTVNSGVEAAPPAPVVPTRTTPTTQVPPTRTTPTTAEPVATARTTASAPTGGASVALDTSSVPAEHQPVAQSLIAAAARLTEKRKRDAVEKALAEMFQRLAKGAISPPALALIADFTNAIGTPASKDIWRKLSDNHWSEVQPFNNVKFL